MTGGFLAARLIDASYRQPLGGDWKAAAEDRIFKRSFFPDGTQNTALDALRVSGHPGRGRSAGVARFLDYVLQHPDVWVCRRVDVARHWMAVHPAV